jgi:hypothetical protein
MRIKLVVVEVVVVLDMITMVVELVELVYSQHHLQVDLVMMVEVVITVRVVVVVPVVLVKTVGDRIHLMTSMQEEMENRRLLREQHNFTPLVEVVVVSLQVVMDHLHLVLAVKVVVVVPLQQVVQLTQGLVVVVVVALEMVLNFNFKMVHREVPASSSSVMLFKKIYN